MKYTNIKIAIAFLTLFAAACSSDTTDDTIQDPAVSVQAVSDLAISGSWVISSLIDEGEDETSDFAGYIFTFNSDGSLSADNGNNTVTGSWSVTEDDSSDDDDYDSRDDIDFNIFFSDPLIFEELTDDWDIVSRSETRIELIDKGDINEGDEILIFEKN